MSKLIIKSITITFGVALMIEGSLDKHFVYLLGALSLGVYVGLSNE